MGLKQYRLFKTTNSTGWLILGRMNFGFFIRKEKGWLLAKIALPYIQFDYIRTT